MPIERNLLNEKGMTLIEVLVSLTILSVGILTVFSMLTSSVRISANTRDKSIAMSLAQELIEEYKARVSEIEANSPNDYNPEVEPIKLNQRTFDRSVTISYDIDNAPPEYAVISVDVGAVGSNITVHRETKIAIYEE